DGMAVINRDFEILYANSSYTRQTGYSPQEIKGMHCYEVTHHNRKPCYMMNEECSVKNAFDTGFSNKIIHTHFNKNNDPVYVETVAYPIKDPHGNVLSVAERVSDITGRMRLDEELRQRIEELEEFYSMAVGRELKMIELKAETEKLRDELNKIRSGAAL
ncbi:MAG: PAS domain-containing protein, partial [Nitrospirae bacterium]|nr:PAS domain-containing protein [Nitrospirota bacterium]